MKEQTTNTAEVRQLVERWAEAARNKDLDAVMACYLPEVVAFDAILALQFRGTDRYRKHWEHCLELMPAGQFILEVHDMEVEVDGSLAFAHYLSRCGCRDDQGKEETGWMRATVCCRKTPAGWRIAHEHYSVPFDPQNGNALTGLER